MFWVFIFRNKKSLLKYYRSFKNKKVKKTSSNFSIKYNLLEFFLVILKSNEIWIFLKVTTNNKVLLIDETKFYYLPSKDFRMNDQKWKGLFFTSNIYFSFHFLVLLYIPWYCKITIEPHNSFSLKILYFLYNIAKQNYIKT